MIQNVWYQKTTKVCSWCRTSFLAFSCIRKYGSLTFNALWANSVDDKLGIFLFIFPRKQDLTLHANCHQLRQ